MSPDRTKKEKVMDDLAGLHHQQELEEQEYEEFLANDSVLPQIRTQSENSNQTSMGEKK